MYKILLLEDDSGFNATLKDFLEEEGFGVDALFDPLSAFESSYTNRYDLYLLDVNLPYENGFVFLKRLRESGDLTPAIFLTSKEGIGSLKEGFNAGGDDYLKKPFELDELLCRISALLRRQIRTEHIFIGEYKFDATSKRLFFKDKEVALSNKAAQLLFLLLEAKGTLVSIERIKERLWSCDEEASEGAIRVYVTQLKRYFHKKIKNIRGIGYCLEC